MIDQTGAKAGTILSVVFAIISLADVHTVVSILAAVTAMGSGFMAGRFYYYRTKNMKNDVND